MVFTHITLLNWSPYCVNITVIPANDVHNSEDAPVMWFFNTPALTTSGYVDVQCEAVLTLVDQQRQQFPQVLVAAQWHLQQGCRSISHVRMELRRHTVDVGFVGWRV